MTRSTTETDYEPTTSSQEWEDYRAQLLRDPKARKEYERALREATVIHQIVQRLEEERERTNISKAELAARAGMNPASVRRLLTAEESNPTFKTIVNLLDALGLEIALRPVRRTKRKDGTKDATTTVAQATVE